jgi:hypothetical protein
MTKLKTIEHISLDGTGEHFFAPGICSSLYWATSSFPRRIQTRIVVLVARAVKSSGRRVPEYARAL